MKKDEVMIDEFNLIITDIINNDTVNLMKNFRQHYDTSCFEHCKNVAFYSYLICRKFKSCRTCWYASRLIFI